MGTNLIVVEYNPKWVKKFEELRDFVFPVLSDLKVTIEHVGSTAIPGIAAKPIVDIDVVVPTQSDILVAVKRLANLGYVHEGDLGIPGREVFIPPRDVDWHHLYLCTVDNAEYKRHILFRDYLRIHPVDAKRYSQLKQMLVKQFKGDRSGYTNAKSDFVRDILKRAGWNDLN
ncbi:GrpB family protein [Bacillus sp. FSL K6-6540]|uniref:GrpB family protein n=1 Tax=Bacillus sp. FSL K6-6540 TaxID=2921512 RepID=UPI0030F4BF3B